METKSKNSLQKVVLILIAIGIWVLVLQNAGVLPSNLSVSVEGGHVNANVSGAVKVKGSVDVDNTVSVSIDEVLGKDDKKYYYNNN